MVMGVCVCVHLPLSGHILEGPTSLHTSITIWVEFTWVSTLQSSNIAIQSSLVCNHLHILLTVAMLGFASKWMEQVNLYTNVNTIPKMNPRCDVLWANKNMRKHNKYVRLLEGRSFAHTIFWVLLPIHCDGLAFASSNALDGSQACAPMVIASDRNGKPKCMTGWLLVDKIDLGQVEKSKAMFDQLMGFLFAAISSEVRSGEVKHFNIFNEGLKKHGFRWDRSSYR